MTLEQNWPHRGTQLGRNSNLCGLQGVELVKLGNSSVEKTSIKFVVGHSFLTAATNDFCNAYSSSTPANPSTCSNACFAPELVLQRHQSVRERKDTA